MVIRGPDNLPASCGILRAFEPLVDNGACRICPLYGYEFTKPDELLNFGGSVDVSCADMKKNVESFRASTDQCIDVQQVTSRACGCAHKDTILASPKSSRNSSPIIIGDIAALVIVGLGVAVFLFSRKGSASKTPKAHSTVGDLMLEQQQQIGHGRDQGTQRISESVVSREQQAPCRCHGHPRRAYRKADFQCCPDVEGSTVARERLAGSTCGRNSLRKSCFCGIVGSGRFHGWCEDDGFRK